MTEAAGDNQPTALSPAESVAALTARLDAIDRAEEPIIWATAAYKLGMATAEQPSAQQGVAMQQALDLYQQAASILSPERAPIEHARILNAAGSAHRLLGNSPTAIKLFQQSLELLNGRGAQTEEASVFNNLGLVLAESGRIDEAVELFARSLAALGDESDDDSTAADNTDAVRTRLATMHNLGQAQMGRGSIEGYTAAVAAFEEGSRMAAGFDVSMHTGLLDHSRGVAHKALASLQPACSQQHVDSAIEAFEQSLAVFTSVGFPMHHAIAKHNLGHTLASRDDLDSMRRALACYEDALQMFDPRLHQAHWQEAYANAEALEVRLLVMEPDASRADHMASLAGSMSDEERLTFLRHRLLLLEPLPKKHVEERLTVFCYAMVTQPPASFVATLRTMVTVLMELPESLLESALRSQVAAHSMLENHERRAVDFVLDEVIQALLFGPQRIRVRDMLEDIGWDRP